MITIPETHSRLACPPRLLQNAWQKQEMHNIWCRHLLPKGETGALYAPALEPSIIHSSLYACRHRQKQIRTKCSCPYCFKLAVLRRWRQTKCSHLYRLALALLCRRCCFPPPEMHIFFFPFSGAHERKCCVYSVELPLCSGDCFLFSFAGCISFCQRIFVGLQS